MDKEVDPLKFWMGGSINATRVVQNIEKVTPDFRNMASKPLEFSSLLKLSPSARAYTIHKMMQVWPYKSERYAFMVTPAVYMFGAGCGAGFITHHLYGEFQLAGAAPRRVMVLMTAMFPTLVQTILSQFTVRDQIMYNVHIQRKRHFLFKQLGINVSLGVLYPFVFTPLTCSAGVQAQNLYNMPVLTNLMDMLYMSMETMKPFFKRYAIPFFTYQFMLAIVPVSIYFHVREQVLPQLETDEELFEELCVKTGIIDTLDLDDEHLIGRHEFHREDDLLSISDGQQIPTYTQRLSDAAGRFYPQWLINKADELVNVLKMNISSEDRNKLKESLKLNKYDKFEGKIFFKPEQFDESDS